MKLHDLAPDSGSRPRKRRVARGNAGKAGTYGGRGRKGQGSRSGGVKAAYFEGGQLPFVRRLPFKRGFKQVGRVTFTPVNVEQLEAIFEAGAAVTPEALCAAGLLRDVHEPYKVLADGGLQKRLVVHAPRFSGAARQAIESAGGACETIEGVPSRVIPGRRHTRWPRPKRFG